MRCWPAPIPSACSRWSHVRRWPPCAWPASVLRPGGGGGADPPGHPGRIGAPYIRRRNGVDPVIYEHPSMAPALQTLGVPLFQEQLMQLAVDCAGFRRGRPAAPRHGVQTLHRTHAPAARPVLRRHARAARPHEVIDRIYSWRRLPISSSSHALSFASLVFYSAWSAAPLGGVLAALLRAQPMGFYSPQSLVADACWHGVAVHGPCVNASLAHACERTPERRCV
ncbi:hypothetical protein ACQKB2_18065 [Mycobacterium tuberculosis]